MQEESRAVKTHQDCPVCGHHDCMTVFENGNTFCMSCQNKTVNKSNEDNHNLKSVGKKLPMLSDLKYKSIPARGILKETCIVYSYAISTDQTNDIVHVANYFNKDGVIVAQKTRTKDKRFIWRGQFKNSLLFGQNVWRSNSGSCVVITEGEIDAMSVYQATNGSIAVVSIPSGAQSAYSSLSEHINWIEQFDKVIIWFDNDNPGKRAREECLKLLSPKKAFFIEEPTEISNKSGMLIETKDANDLLQNDMSTVIVDLVNSASQYQPDDILTLKDINLKQLIQSRTPGFQIPYPILNNTIHGIKPGWVYSIAASPKVGKTTFATDIIYHFAFSNIPVAILAIEDNETESFKRIISYMSNIPEWKFDYESEELIQQQFSYIKDKLAKLPIYYIKNNTENDAQHIYDRIKYLIYAKGVQVILLDNMSAIQSSNGMDLQQTNKYFHSLVDLCKCSKCALINILHLTKNNRHDLNGNILPVTEDSIYGSGNFSKFSHCSIALEPGDEELTTKIKVLNCRGVSAINKYCDVLRYDPEIGRVCCNNQQYFNIMSGSQGELLIEEKHE